MRADSTCQDTASARHIQAILDELGQLQQTPWLMTSPEDLEVLEHEIRQRTDHLGSLLVGYQLQQALNAAALQVEQERLVRPWPQSLKHDGRVQVRGRTAQGHTVPVWVTYYRRQERRAGKRDAGRVGWSGTLRNSRPLHTGVGRRGEPVGRDGRLSGRGPGRVGRPGRGVGYQN